VSLGVPAAHGCSGLPAIGSRQTRKFVLYGIDAMTIHPKRLFLAGLVVAALAIAGYAARSGNGEFPGALSSFGSHDASGSGALDTLSAGSTGSGPVVGGSPDDTVAQILQAIRDSLQRNDLASARSLLNAVHAFGKDDKRVLTLQRDLQAREKKTDDAPRAAAVDESQTTQEPARVAAGSMERPDHVRDGSLPTREHAVIRLQHARSSRASQVKVVPARAVNVDTASAGSVSGETTRTSMTAVSPPTGPSAGDQATPILPPGAQSAPAAQTPQMAQTIQVTQTAQAMQSGPGSTASGQGPKTRAQVRAELERARDNGTLPRFGNPDPAGPGRSPNSVANQAALPGHE
jgi:Domain of unknown function (DUF4148)